jgi:hypothetical protein
MAELKTKRTGQNVASFLNAIEDSQLRADCKAISGMMKAATGDPARMWGSGIVGFGTYDYKYASGREGTWFLCGFAPRKRNLSLYIMAGFPRFDPLMKKLGKYKTGKACLYINRLDDIDRSVLQTLIKESVAYMRRKYPTV